MATTTLVFPVNPFATSETKYQLPEPARIDDTRNRAAKYSPGARQSESGTGSADDGWSDFSEEVEASARQAADFEKDSEKYVGIHISVYA